MGKSLVSCFLTNGVDRFKPRYFRRLPSLNLASRPLTSHEELWCMELSAQLVGSLIRFTS